MVCSRFWYDLSDDLNFLDVLIISHYNIKSLYYWKGEIVIIVCLLLIRVNKCVFIEVFPGWYVLRCLFEYILVCQVTDCG